MAILSNPITIRNMQLKNRIVMPPMCQYSVQAKDGTPNDWHYVHYVSRAVGGAGLVIMEMTDIEPDGRITDYDLGFWSDDQVPAYKRIVDEVHKYGTKIGIQIAHAGRKAQDAEVPVAPSSIAESPKSKTPRELSTAEVRDMVEKFRKSFELVVEAGFDTIEIHGAHGYLIHQFMSPGINRRDDEYGQDLARFGVEVVKAAKSVMPAGMPLLMRISAIEYMDGGYDIDHSLNIAARFLEAGVDAFHITSGGEGPAGARKPGNYPGYQVPMARAFKEALGVPVIAVGLIDEASLAEATVANGDADLVAVGRGMLRDPYWATHALRELSGKVEAPKQYERAY